MILAGRYCCAHRRQAELVVEGELVAVALRVHDQRVLDPVDDVIAEVVA